MVVQVISAAIGFLAASLLPKNPKKVKERTKKYAYNFVDKAIKESNDDSTKVRQAILDKIHKSRNKPSDDFITFAWQRYASHFFDDSRSESFSRGGRVSKLHKQLKLGTKVEMEHKDTIRKFKKEGMTDIEVARMIALDHLKEDPNYYTKIK